MPLSQESTSMSNSLRHRSIAVAVIHDAVSDRYLLWRNKRWRGYALPMNDFEPDANVDPAKMALAAIDRRDLPLKLPNAAAYALDRHGELEWSESAGEVTYYDYHIFAIE